MQIPKRQWPTPSYCSITSSVNVSSPGRSVTMNDDDLSSMVEIVDALFRILAEEAAGREGVTFEEAHEGTWALFEHGFVRLVGDRDNLGIGPCISRNERRAAAKPNRVLASYRRRRAGDAPDEPGEPPAWIWLAQVEDNAQIATKTGRIARCLVESCVDTFIDTGVSASISLPGYSDRAIRVALKDLVRCGHLTFDGDSQGFRPQLLPELTDEEWEADLQALSDLGGSRAITAP